MNSTSGCILGRFCVDDEMWINIFLRPDMSSHASENRKWIQPVVVLCCKHNITMRILNKIQLIVEFSLVF